jgi:hypothetical protein
MRAEKFLGAFKIVNLSFYKREIISTKNFGGRVMRDDVDGDVEIRNNT